MASITQVKIIQEVKMDLATHSSEVLEVPQHITSMLPEEELTQD